jgi:hypothetical protein
MIPTLAISTSKSMSIVKRVLIISDKKDFKFPKRQPLCLRCEMVVVRYLDAYPHNPNSTTKLFYPQWVIKCVKSNNYFDFELWFMNQAYS